MALELAKSAEVAIMKLYPQGTKALEPLGDLYKSTFSAVERRLKWARAQDMTYNILDLAVLRIVEHISWQLLTEPDATPGSVGVPALLDLCIEGVRSKFLLIHTPYKVLEDLTEGQTISTCELLWDLMVTRKDKLTTKDFIPEAGKTTKASLCLLRMCNALLRRLSKTHNSVFCGKILVFLSSTFALSERSAMNLPGKANLANVTVFEDEDAFEAAESTESSSKHAPPVALEINPKDEGSASGPIDYNLYRTFWDLQRYFREHTLATSSAAQWEQFFEELKTVLSAFEGNAFSPDDLERTRDLMTGAMSSSSATSADTAESQDHFFQPKYLTNSRLFRLQLRDPILRESMLTQILVLFNHLGKQKAPEDAKTPKSTISELQERVMNLLKQTPSDGEGFSEMVSRVLERERNWIVWKNEKCQAYERFPETETAAAPEGDGKKNLGDTPMLSARTTKRVRKSTPEDSGLLEQILTQSSKPSQILEKIKGDERATEVSMDKFVEKFVEAWDPENGIEEDYWPDKDTMHCWRTMRAAMKSSVEFLDLSIDGAGAVVKGIKGISDPPKPAKETVEEPVPVAENGSTKQEPKEKTERVEPVRESPKEKPIRVEPVRESLKEKPVRVEPPVRESPKEKPVRAEPIVRESFKERPVRVEPSVRESPREEGRDRKKIVQLSSRKREHSESPRPRSSSDVRVRNEGSDRPLKRERSNSGRTRNEEIEDGEEI